MVAGVVRLAIIGRQCAVLVLLVLGLLATPVRAAITYDAVSSAATGAAGTTLSWSHTLGAGFFRLVTVGVAVEDASNTDCVVTGVTFNGVAMTQANSTNVLSTSVYLCVSLWYILEANLPAAGTYVIGVTTAAASDDITAEATSLAGVKQVAPQATTTNSCTTCSNALSTSITTALPDEWIVDAIGCGNTGTYTATGTNQTARASVGALSSGSAVATTVTTAAGLQTVSWTHSAANRMADVLASFIPEPTTTIAFQDGVAPTAGYSGTSDTYINEGAATTNYGTVDTLMLDGNDGTEFSSAALMKFDLSSIPAGSVILSATLILNSINATAASYPIYRLLRNWNASQATWNNYATGSAWTTAGAQGAGTDYDATTLGNVTGGTGATSIALNAAGVGVVQSWVNGNLSNFGMITRNYAVTDGFDFSSDDHATASNHPRLVVNYRPRRIFLP